MYVCVYMQILFVEKNYKCAWVLHKCLRLQNRRRVYAGTQFGYKQNSNNENNLYVQIYVTLEAKENFFGMIKSLGTEEFSKRETLHINRCNIHNEEFSDYPNYFRMQFQTTHLPWSLEYYTLSKISLITMTCKKKTFTITIFLSLKATFVSVCFYISYKQCESEGQVDFGEPPFMATNENQRERQIDKQINIEKETEEKTEKQNERARAREIKGEGERRYTSWSLINASIILKTAEAEIIWQYFYELKSASVFGLQIRYVLPYLA